MKNEQPGFGEAMAAALAQDQVVPAMTESRLLADEESKLAYRHRQLRRNFVEMGRRAASEIKHLRAQVEALRPKAEAYDLMSKVVHHSLPGAPQAYSEDLAWRIEKEIEAAQAEDVAETGFASDGRLDPAKHAHEV